MKVLRQAGNAIIWPTASTRPPQGAVRSPHPLEAALRGEARPDVLRLSDGEIHFLYWFIQGSIMVPETRWRLRKAWGMCERHAWGAVAAEASYRHGFLHGPALLYEDIMARALPPFQAAGPLKGPRIAWGLRHRGPCMMCEMGYGPSSPATASADLLRGGRDLSYLLAFGKETMPFWSKAVCGRCLGDGSGPRCRRHLLEEALDGACGDLAAQRALVEYIARHVSAFARSFVWGKHHLRTEEGRAALISAAGWCSGWQTFIALMERMPEDG